MQAYTPGPWEAKGKSVRTTGHTAQGSAPNGYEGGICNCFGKRMGPRAKLDEMAEANARLIAAAPELLEALRWYIAHDAKEFQYLDKGIGTSTPDGIQRLKAREAVAKAFGLPPA